MSRKKTQPKKNITPDPKYNSTIIPKLINNKMFDGKRGVTSKIVYNELDRVELNLFDILSGNKNHIEFIDLGNDKNRYDFNIPSIGFEGYFLFEPTSGALKLISFDNDLKHSISIDINEIELLDIYNPEIEKEDFEVIDLRG